MQPEAFVDDRSARRVVSVQRAGSCKASGLPQLGGSVMSSSVVPQAGAASIRVVRQVRFAAAIAAGFVMSAGMAQAADLSSKYDPYEDPRYSDIYRDPPPRPRYVEPAPRYVEPAPRYVEPAPRYIEPAPRYAERAPRYIAPEPSYKDEVPRDRYGRLRPFRDERRFVERHPDDRVYRERADRCVPREVVRERLVREGWHDFHAAELVGEFAEVNARDGAGRLYLLRVDRCSGEIVEARRLERRHGPLAWQPPRRDRYRF